MRFMEFGTGLLMPVSNEEQVLIRRIQESDSQLERSKLDEREAELAFKLVSRGVIYSEENNGKIIYKVR